MTWLKVPNEQPSKSARLFVLEVLLLRIVELLLGKSWIEHLPM